MLWEFLKAVLIAADRAGSFAPKVAEAIARSAGKGGSAQHGGLGHDRRQAAEGPSGPIAGCDRRAVMKLDKDCGTCKSLIHKD